MIRCFNFSLLPPGCTGYHVWLWTRDYGDVVIWVHRLWISWNWFHEMPRANRQEVA